MVPAFQWDTGAGNLEGAELLRGGWAPFLTPALFMNNLGRNPDFTGTLCPWEMCLPTLQKGF